MADETLKEAARAPSKFDLCRLMKPQQVEKYKEHHQKGHSSCLQKIDQWEKYKKDYEVLKSRVESLPDRISYDIMVPFGSHAFMPGKMIHTNEIMTLLGCNWFAEVSAKHAAEISERRIQQCGKMLEDLKKEKEQFENWLHYVDEVTGGENLVDLTEYDPEEIEEEKCQRGQPKKRTSGIWTYKRKQIPKETTEMHNKDDFLILDKLGEEETFKGELDDDVSSDVGDGDCDELEDKDHHEGSEGDITEEENEECSSDEHSKSDGKHVKWKDQEGEKMKNRITFTHSSRKSKSHSSTKPMPIHKSKPKSRESAPLSPVKIQSPSDIYKCFVTKPEQSELKSILKRTSSVDESDESTESAAGKNVEEESALKARFKGQTAFTGEVVECEAEKSSFSETMEGTTQRPPSRFKALRQNKHK